MNTISIVASSVLIVEDESIVALDISQHLESLGYRIIGNAISGEDAISLARLHQPDLVLMDIMLKGAMNGIEAAKHINRELNTPVVFLTANSDPETILKVIETAPYGYLTKPFQIRELHATIEVAIYKSRIERKLRESEHWFASTLRCVGDGVIATDVDNNVRFLNPIAESLTGWSLEAAVGKSLENIMFLEAHDTHFPLENPGRRALNENRVIGIEHGVHLLSKDGKTQTIDQSAAPIRGENNDLLGAVVVFRDVAERLKQELKLRASEERFRMAFDFAPGAMALVSVSGHILKVNSVCSKLLGYSADEITSMHYEDVTHPNDIDSERDHQYELLAGQQSVVQFEKRYLRKDGESVWTLVSVSVLTGEDVPLSFLYQFYDLTQRKEAENVLARLAYSDPLTGLANRVRLQEDLEQMLAVARRNRQQIAVVFMDVDRFKYINDSLGHETGDAVLKILSSRLMAELRETDCVARIGGDEFVMILSEVKSIGSIATVMEKIRVSVSKPMHINHHEVLVTPSIGISIYPNDGDDPQSLIRSADNALYAAKAHGRNCIQFFRPELAQQAEDRLELEAMLYKAFEQREFHMEYQPIVMLSDGRVLGFEALVRWHRPTGQQISPADFIPVAEETGLIIQLGAWILNESCKTAATWPESVRINVNCSARQFREDDFVEMVEAALIDSGLNPTRLSIELTEGVLLLGEEMPDAKLARLKALGVALSIDDYGTGYSSLAYIKRFAPRSLKIDGMFIRDLVENADSAAIVSATIMMAHQLGLKVVAECVETREQINLLNSYQCDAVQGFYYSKSVTPEKIPSLFDSILLKHQ